jgi:predicted outer membrane repeat protein
MNENNGATNHLRGGAIFSSQTEVSSPAIARLWPDGGKVHN